MKRILCVMLFFLLLLGTACAESENRREWLNPEHYPLLKVSDAFQADDDDYVVQGSFGDFDFTNEPDIERLGFEEPVYTLILTDDVVIEMSANMDDEPNIPMTRQELVDVVAKIQQEEDPEYVFYADFEMNEEGNITKLVYRYLPF